MTELIKYDAACRMLAEAVAVDEVQNIRNQAEAMRAYARQAKDRDLEISAAQIRFRAERRLGELILAQKETIGLAKGGTPYRTSTCSDAEQVETERPPTLEQAGIDRKLSSRAQRMAAIEPSRFEALLERHREEVLEGNNKVSVDLMRTSAEADGRDRRRSLATVLSDATAALPTGRRFPVIYADPPWHRKQGVTSRSYENHYPTMAWSEICAMPVADLLLPDAWVFLWIPRAHMFALHAVDMEFADDSGCVITRKVKLPLAWAVARAWGCDDYSTAWVWTKTDEEFPDDQGGGVVAYDQDEILLLFKRGRGMPKPDTDEKFGSNHRERSKPLGHSSKPKFYRHMIRTMAGEGVPVLELFARVDPAIPMPADWEVWGNEAQIVVQVADDAAVEPEPDVVEPAAAADLVEAPPALPLDEYDALQAISLVARRADAAPIVAAYVEQGLAFYMGPERLDWSLTVEGWKRFQALERERKQLAERGDNAACPPAQRERLSVPDSGIVDQPDVIPVAADAAVPPAERPGSSFEAAFRDHLGADEFAQWSAFAAVRAGDAIDRETARGLIGSGHLVVLEDKLAFTEPGLKLLRCLEQFVERSERIQGRTLGIDLASPPAEQVDLEDLLAAAPPLDLPLFLNSRESAA